MILRFVVPGRAQPAGSKRAMPIRNKATGQIVGTNVVDANPKAKVWQLDVKQAAENAMQGHPATRSPVRLSLLFVFLRPKSHFDSKGVLLPRAESAVPTARPDSTKLLRSAEDALTGVVYADDAQCYRVVSEKAYGNTARCQITLEWVPHETEGWPERYGEVIHIPITAETVCAQTSFMDYLAEDVK